MGGMCFVTTRQFMPATKLGIDLKTPYLADTTYLEGMVHQSHEKVNNMLYETRLEFTSLKPDAEFLLAKLIEYFVTEANKHNA